MRSCVSVGLAAVCVGLLLLSGGCVSAEKYNEAVDTLGKRIDSVKDQFEAVRRTRSDMLQKPLDKIEEIRQSRALPEP